MFEYGLEIGLLLAGLATLVVGYRRDRRNVLLAAALLLLASGTLGNFVHGFQDGWATSSARPL